MLAFIRARVLLIAISAFSGVAGLVFVLALERIVVGWDRSSLKKLLRPSPSLKRDIIAYCVDITGLLAVLGNLAALGTAFYYGHLVRQYLGLNLLRSVPTFIAQNLLLIFIIGFFDYWFHWLMHKVPWMWEIHKYHHSATEMGIVTARRDSILVVPLATFFKAIPFAVLGIPRAYPIFAGIISAHAMLIHSELDWDFGWFGRWILISPHDHRVHHSMDGKHMDKNFAFLLPIWDQLFGTFYAERDEVARIGLDDDYYNKHSYAKGMLCSIQSSLKSMFCSVRARFG
jgi:sterol desaturase/sphingolipid hydroxylase (fatty acid hydroxylase superfamily)